MMGMFFMMLFMIPMCIIMDYWMLMLMFMLMFFMYLNSIWMESYWTMLSYSLGGDFLSWSLVLLTLWIIMLMIMASTKVLSESMYLGEFSFILLSLSIVLCLSFTSSNFFLFYLFFESSLIPTLFLIYGWGYQPERISAGYYLLFYTLFASLPLLISLFYINMNSCTLYFDLIGLCMNMYIFMALIFAFLIKMPLIMFHFWLLKAHVEAPVSGSMILAGVLLKLGGYGLYRVYSFMYEYSLSFNIIFVLMSLLGTFVVGVMCLVQIDIKTLIAYSSVAHMGLVISGLMIFNDWGILGSIILMIGHGLCSSALFCLANIVYERLHSRSIFINKGLMSFMPSMCLLWFLLCIGNMAAPPTLNLVGEIMLINGILSWSSYTWLLLGFSCFLSCCYSIYLYSYTQHGSLSSMSSPSSYGCMREYYLIMMHWLPLNLFILKLEFLTQL
uniref:NADH-ubiquinone oxidoreductase chain 4 n=1 Tax=Alloeorhynchus bakeri TaxID=796621 RepID=G9B4J1_9HEMI|nr:NADH dehydrogenase subunit 4 [Alloeorhynchus bakeri]ADI75227.1 NADH dehydrogenase subunit 4 [Alloeorhynchus bakeri]